MPATDTPRIISTVSEMRAYTAAARQAGETIGFVPTMGYLHEGHRSLMAEARRRCGRVVVSIYVNPLQFGPTEDFARYPRDLDRDVALCASVPVDVVFAPADSEMYPDGPAAHRTTVEIAGLTAGLCGASRPGHFRGVATVVTKLLNIVQPDLAFFGQKDAQQVAVIRRMVTDLNLPTTIVPMPIIREADGLALSSRNVYLSPAERQAALVLSHSLQRARDLVAAGQRETGPVAAAITDLLTAEPLARIDYVSLIDADTLEPALRFERPVLIALAVYIGRTRLIDNTVIEV